MRYVGIDYHKRYNAGRSVVTGGPDSYVRPAGRGTPVDDFKQALHARGRMDFRAIASFADCFYSFLRCRSPNALPRVLYASRAVRPLLEAEAYE